MKRIFLIGMILLTCATIAAQTDTIAMRYTNTSVLKFKEQMQLSQEQMLLLDSIFAINIKAQNSVDTTLVCLRARDSEITAILTSSQKAKYDILKQEWKSRLTAKQQTQKKRLPNLK
jgi:hypothetical protein